jgi:outer membrane protein assembly factor BamB
MRILALIAIVLVSCEALLSAEIQRNSADAWPTLHGDLQRSGFYPKFPEGPYKLVWRKELFKELTGPRCEVILGDGLAFLGTYAGKIYAWDAGHGEQKWSLTARGPIGHSPMYDAGTLYFGSMDRTFYALNAADGKMKWQFEAGEGIWTSPLVFNGLVMFGARDGVFYALNAANGKPVWNFKTADCILTTASISEDGENVIFGSEDMHVYCLNLRDGSLKWKSRKLQGLSLRDYFPVIVKGKVLITTNPVKHFHAIMGEQQNLLLKRTNFQGKDNRYIPGTPEDVEKEQIEIVEYLKANPAEQTFYAFNVSDGLEPWIAPIFYTAGLHNPPTPPCVNPTTGEVFVNLRSAYGVWDGGGEVRPYTCVGKLHLETGRVALIEHGHKSKEPDRPAGAKDMPWGSFNTIGDETQALSCSPEFLLQNHQGFLGSMNFKTGILKAMFGKRDSYAGFYGPAIFGWESQGGEEKARQQALPYGLVNEWHGPAKGIASVAGRFIYYTTGAQVLCFEGQP